MKINTEKLSQTVKMQIPNTKNNKYPNGFSGFFEPKDGYNKLVAYGPNEEKSFSWIHKEYKV